MHRCKSKFTVALRLSLQIAAVITLAMGAAAIARAQSASSQNAVHSAKNAAATLPSSGATAKATAPANAANTGIKVHGHWIIEVRNPDGSLVTHREFDNEIQIAGVATLASLMARSQTPGAWAIGLGDAGSPPCTASMGFVSFFTTYQGVAAKGCFIGEPSGVYSVPCSAAQNCTPNLAISTFSAGSAGAVPSSSGGFNIEFCTVDQSADVLPCPPTGTFNILGFQLKGYAVAQQSGQVTLVETALMGCGAAIAPGTCASTTSPGISSNTTFAAAAGPTTGTAFFTPFGSVFTGTYVPGAAIQVGAQQAVNVTVQISFQ
jgi:hypothetical protein